ncbi:MAG: DivIVA domain-containing protein [Erysipelotrichaceae bacterium]|nr:DivIVA domain-containing protein [Erysipelotrichaceae bacterium]
MDKVITLSVDEILNKEFFVDYRGYSPIEVDQFLDIVMADYKAYDETIAQLGERLAEYEKTIATLKAKLVEVEGQNMYRANSMAQTNNMNNNSQVDILKRIARLEQEVFGKRNF